MPGLQRTSEERSAKHDRLVDSLSALIHSLGLSPGDRLPAERELAQQFGVTRGDVRRAVGYLAALGMLEVRHGVGAFLVNQPNGLGTEPLRLLRAIGSYETWQLFEARRTLETELAGLAAERARAVDRVTFDQELAGMTTSLNDAGEFLVHDIRFHRAIAQASGNAILAALMEVVASALYKERANVAGTSANRRDALEHHHDIYKAVGARDGAAARLAMERHLKLAESSSI